MNKVLKILNSLLLLGILSFLVLIYLNLPPKSPTIGAYLKAKTEDEKRAVLMNLPFVHVEGNVSVNNTVDVNVNNTPLEVENR